MLGTPTSNELKKLLSHIEALSHRYLIKYKLNECDVESIRDLAISYDGYGISIWIETFKDFPEVQLELNKDI